MVVVKIKPRALNVQTVGAIDLLGLEMNNACAARLATEPLSPCVASLLIGVIVVVRRSHLCVLCVVLRVTVAHIAVVAVAAAPIARAPRVRRIGRLMLMLMLLLLLRAVARRISRIVGV